MHRGVIDLPGAYPQVFSNFLLGAVWAFSLRLKPARVSEPRMRSRGPPAALRSGDSALPCCGTPRPADIWGPFYGHRFTGCFQVNMRWCPVCLSVLVVFFFLRGRAGRLVIKLKGSQRRKKVFSGSITHTHFLHQHVPFGVSQTKHEASDRIGVQGSSKGACFNRQLPSIPLTQFPQATSHNKRKGLWGFSARLWLPRTGVLRLHVCL